VSSECLVQVKQSRHCLLGSPLFDKKTKELQVINLKMTMLDKTFK